MKKFFLLCIFMSFTVGLILYFFFSAENIEKENIDNNDSEEFKTTVGHGNKIENNDSAPQIKTLDENKTINKNDKIQQNKSATKIKIGFEKSVKENWSHAIKEFFIKELNLSESIFEDYIQLRSEFIRDREIAYKHYIQKMKDKYGDDYTSNPDAVNDVFINTNYSEYTNALSALIDQENMDRYFLFKAEYNESLESVIEGDQDQLLIEY